MNYIYTIKLGIPCRCLFFPFAAFCFNKPRCRNIREARRSSQFADQRAKLIAEHLLQNTMIKSSPGSDGLVKQGVIDSLTKKELASATLLSPALLYLRRKNQIPLQVNPLRPTPRKPFRSAFDSRWRCADAVSWYADRLTRMGGHCLLRSAAAKPAPCWLKRGKLPCCFLRRLRAKMAPETVACFASSIWGKRRTRMILEKWDELDLLDIKRGDIFTPNELNVICLLSL